MDMLRLLARFADALARGEADTAAELFTENAVYEEPPRFRFEGREAIRAFLRDFAARHHNARFTITRQIADESTQLLAAEWEWRYVRANDGAKRAFVGVSFIAFEGELIFSWRGFSATVTP
jgi:limonene-1,2-epoxide hydrolase